MNSYVKDHKEKTVCTVCTAKRRAWGLDRWNKCI